MKHFKDGNVIYPDSYYWLPVEELVYYHNEFMDIHLYYQWDEDEEQAAKAEDAYISACEIMEVLNAKHQECVRKSIRIIVSGVFLSIEPHVYAKETDLHGKL